MVFVQLDQFTIYNLILSLCYAHLYVLLVNPSFLIPISWVNSRVLLPVLMCFTHSCFIRLSSHVFIMSLVFMDKFFKDSTVEAVDN